MGCPGRYRQIWQLRFKWVLTQFPRGEKRTGFAGLHALNGDPAGADAARRQRVALGRHLLGVGVCDHDAQALHPLLGVLAVLRLEYERLVVAGEDLERLRNVAGAARHLHRPDLVHVYALAAALKKSVKTVRTRNNSGSYETVSTFWWDL